MGPSDESDDDLLAHLIINIIIIIISIYVVIDRQLLLINSCDAASAAVGDEMNCGSVQSENMASSQQRLARSRK